MYEESGDAITARFVKYELKRKNTYTNIIESVDQKTKNFCQIFFLFSLLYNLFINASRNCFINESIFFSSIIDNHINNLLYSTHMSLNVDSGWKGKTTMLLLGVAIPIICPQALLDSNLIAEQNPVVLLLSWKPKRDFKLRIDFPSLKVFFFSVFLLCVGRHNSVR